MKSNLSTVSAAIIAVLLAPPANTQVTPEITQHSGMCDASAAVAIGATMFAVANDEDNVLRVYERDGSGEPQYTLDLASFLKLDEEHPEADIEGATLIGHRIYWITSHGANKNGKRRPNRRRLFATELQVNGDKVNLTTVGTPYQDLVKDLDKAPGLKDYKLGQTGDKPPEEKGGLNIEGLSRIPQCTLLIAFRNPITDGKALLVPVENPEELVDGKTAKLGKPILLSLGGLGIRSIEYFEPRGQYLIVAGPNGDKGKFKLYQWSGCSCAEPEPVERIDFDGFRPEALIVYPGEKTKIEVFSDDGSERVEGKDCKDPEVKPDKKSFRSVSISLL